MEGNKEDQKMNLDKDQENHELSIPIHMDEEEEEINTDKPQKKKEKNKNATSADLNISNIANYSNNSKKSNKSEESKIIYPPQEPNTDYLFNLEYFDEMYENFLLDEKNSKINPRYMEAIQGDINENMRAILVDWLIEVHYQYNFKRKTLFQAIYILDLYLSKKTIERIKFQLLGIACLLIASKVNEIDYPRLGEFVHITDDAYTIQELLNVEIDVMQTLNFEIFFPTAEDFYGIISKTYDFTKKQYFLGEYLLDTSLIDYNLLKFQPSVISASCSYIVMKFFGIKEYKSLYSSIYTKMDCKKKREKAIKDCAKEICLLIKQLYSSASFRFVKKKYSLLEFGNVSELFMPKDR